MKQGNINKQQAQKQPYKSVWIIKYKLLNVRPSGDERVKNIYKWSL